MRVQAEFSVKDGTFEIEVNKEQFPMQETFLSASLHTGFYSTTSQHKKNSV